MECANEFITSENARMRVYLEALCKRLPNDADPLALSRSVLADVGMLL